MQSAAATASTTQPQAASKPVLWQINSNSVQPAYAGYPQVECYGPSPHQRHSLHHSSSVRIPVVCLLHSYQWRRRRKTRFTRNMTTAFWRPMRRITTLRLSATIFYTFFRTTFGENLNMLSLHVTRAHGCVLLDSPAPSSFVVICNTMVSRTPFQMSSALRCAKAATVYCICPDSREQMKTFVT